MKGLSFLLATLFLFLTNHMLHAGDLEIRHHDLDVRLEPKTHTMTVRDTLSLVGDSVEAKEVQFLLNSALILDDVRVGSQSVPFQEEPSAGLTVDDVPKRGRSARTVRVTLPVSINQMRSFTLTAAYHGQINDPPRPSKGLRFVRPDQTNGHIGPEGVYLTSETHWYADIPDSLPTYRVRVTVPEEWEVVTHGREIGRSRNDKSDVTTVWDVDVPTEALTLVANRFVKNRRDWKGIELATYLFPQEAHLAEEYLDAAATYLEVYVKLLGPYPFPKFAVVENFFPSGIGLPSFTLLGERVVRRHYIQPYSLGHEIVHSWFGNFVFNDFRKGNWVEGLTTYLTNYYYEELHQTAERAKELRWRMALEYSLYITPEQDYPVVQFHHKETRQDNAIGYQKAAMIFHMLRREIGDRAFFKGVQTLVAEHGSSSAGWDDLEKVFEQASGKNLAWFFTQWVTRAGAPSLNIVEAHAGPDPSGDYEVQLTMARMDQSYRLRLPVFIEMTNGQVHHTTIILESRDPSVTLRVPGQPRRLSIDPDFQAFRRLSRDRVPPILNLWTTDLNRALVLPGSGSEEERAPYQTVIGRIRSQEFDVVEWMDHQKDLGESSVLVLGGPGVNRLAQTAVEGCGDAVTIGRDHVSISGQQYEGPGIALLVSCPHPHSRNHVVTLFYGVSPSAASRVARLLFFYGWHGYLIFQDGAVVKRGYVQRPMNDVEVEFDQSG